MSFLEVAEVVDTIAGDHGVGRIDQIIGPAFAPAGLRRGDARSPRRRPRSRSRPRLPTSSGRALDPRLAMLKMQLSAQYAAIVDSGDWYSPARQALDAFVATAMSSVSGTVRVMLSRGACRVAGRELADPSPRAVTSSSAGVEPAL